MFYLVESCSILIFMYFMEYYAKLIVVKHKQNEQAHFILRNPIQQISSATEATCSAVCSHTRNSCVLIGSTCLVFKPQVCAVKNMICPFHDTMAKIIGNELFKVTHEFFKDHYETCNLCGGFPVSIPSKAKQSDVVNFIKDQEIGCYSTCTGDNKHNWYLHRSPFESLSLVHHYLSHDKPNSRNADKIVICVNSDREHQWPDNHFIRNDYRGIAICLPCERKKK